MGDGGNGVSGEPGGVEGEGTAEEGAEEGVAVDPGDGYGDVTWGLGVVWSVAFLSGGDFVVVNGVNVFPASRWFMVMIVACSCRCRCRCCHRRCFLL